jgi:predicted dehydrogenase
MNLRPLRIGLAGYGSFARFLQQSWSSLEDVQIVAAASLHDSPENIRSYEHWDALLTDKEVDLVAVTTPPNLHAAVAGAVMEAGKHVLIEKPVATAVADADRLLEIRNRTRRVATVDFMMRFTPISEILASWKRDRPFGRLRRAVIENHAQDETLPNGHWFWDAAQSGGILVEHGGHFFDLIASITDARPLRVDRWAYRRPNGMQDRMLATVYYDDGLTFTQYHTFSRPYFFERTTIQLWFDLAELELEGWFPLSGRIRALTNAATEPALAMLPHFTETARRAVPGRSGALPRPVQIGGEPFPASDEIAGTFDIRRPKMDVYADALRAMLNDVHRAIDDPAHRLRVPLESGVEALRLAVEESDQAAFTQGTTASTNLEVPL